MFAINCISSVAPRVFTTESANALRHEKNPTGSANKVQVASMAGGRYMSWEAVVLTTSSGIFGYVMGTGTMGGCGSPSTPNSKVDSG